MTNMLDAALALAARGFRVIPLHDPGPKGKRPRLNDWAAAATTNPETVRSWWTSWPAANVGAAMGGPERVIAIDVDGEEGAQSADTLETGACLPPTLCSVSGSGAGRHLFYCLQPHQDISRITNRVKFRAGLDVRAEGGQVVLPPSVHESGRAYAWDNARPVAALPDRLYDLIATPADATRLLEARTPRTDPPLIDRIEAARKAVLTLPPAISGQGGHNALLVAATTAYRGFDLPRAAAELVLDEYNRTCAPLWSPAELAHKLAAVEQNERVGEQWGYLLEIEDMSRELDPRTPEIAPSTQAAGVPWIRWGGELTSPVEPTPWVVPELQICPGRPTMIAGYGASGKTLLAQALLLSFASGKPIWSAFTGAKQGRARHFDHEQGTHATKKRYQRLAHGLDLGLDTSDVDLAVASFPDVYLNAKNAREAYALTFAGVDIAVIDALRGATPGEDENDSKIRTCIDNLGWVSERTGTAFILIHHGGKTPGEDARTGPRGSSAIFDGCGCVLAITAEDNEGPKTIRQIKQPAEGEGPIQPFAVSIDDVDGRRGLRVSYRKAEAPETPDDRRGRISTAVLAWVEAHPGESIRGIREGVEGKNATIDWAVESLRASGALINRKANGPAVALYTRTNDTGKLE